MLRKDHFDNFGKDARYKLNLRGQTEGKSRKEPDNTGFESHSKEIGFKSSVNHLLTSSIT